MARSVGVDHRTHSDAHFRCCGGGEELNVENEEKLRFIAAPG